MATLYRSDLPAVRKNTKLIEITGIYTMFEAERPPEFYFGGECHSAWEMVYIIDGHVGITADDKVYSLTSGDVVFHKPMEFHKIWTENNSRPRVFIFSFDLEGSLAYKLKYGVYRLWEQPAQVMRCVLELLRESGVCENNSTGEINYKDGNAGSSSVVIQLAMNYLEILMLYLAASDNRKLPAQASENVHLYTKIVGILEANAYGWITIPEISELCGVSSATVKNCFSGYAGFGIHKYLLKIKIRIAIELLRSGKSVSEVSDLLQFGNPNYFSYVFKRETGKCASQYK